MNVPREEDLVNYLNGDDNVAVVGERSASESDGHDDDDGPDFDIDRPSTAGLDFKSDLQTFISGQSNSRSRNTQPIDSPIPIKLTTSDGRLMSIRKVTEPKVMKQIAGLMSPSQSLNSNHAKHGPRMTSQDCFEYAESLIDENGKKMTRNAINARETRIRKKQFVEGLEKSVQDLSSENSSLKQQVSNMQSTIESLTKDVFYLKGVLANQSHLSALLRNIHNTPGVNFSTSFEFEAAPQAEEDIDLSSAKTSVKRNIDCVDSHSDRNDEENKSPRASTPGSSSLKVQKVDHAYNRPVTRRSAGMKNSDKQKREKACDSHSEKQKKSVKFCDLDLKDAGGVCLHVSKGNVSLEFCASCSRNAANGRPKDS